MFTKHPRRKLKLFACEILFREFCHYAARSRNRIDVEFLPKGLHDIGHAGMADRLARALAGVDETNYDAILLGYALCSGGIVGLSARTIPIVVPRAHDCITLLLGSRRRYRDYFFANAGTYFESTGWLERGSGPAQTPQLGLSVSQAELIERYGEENARYLAEQLTGMRHYSKLAFIETGIEPNDSFERRAHREAAERGWEYEKLHGDLDLIRRLLDGDWDDDFLVVPPGGRIVHAYDDDVVRCDHDKEPQTQAYSPEFGG